ncbi:hypothetical protein D3C81_1270320 [compost metagenome]
MEILREKNKGLELRLADLVRHGHDNDRTQQRLHDWQLRLLAEADSHALPYAVQDGLQQVFDVPAVALRLWDVAEQYVHMEVAQGASEDLRLFAEGLRAPYCGANSGFEAAALLERDDIVSLAMVALRVPVRAADAGADVQGTACGLLVLGSPDPRRFHEGMGTAYLAQIGEVAGAAVNRLRD